MDLSLDKTFSRDGKKGTELANNIYDGSIRLEYVSAPLQCPEFETFKWK